MTVHIARIRIGGSKVRTGCRTCKNRRIKCDEARPLCQRCIKSGQTCEGYFPSSNAKQNAAGHRFVHYVAPCQITIPGPGPVVSQHTDLSLHALRSLDFFLNSTATQLERPFGLGLWSQAISCLLYSQPAVKYGLIALAAFHENYQHASRSPFVEGRRILALEHYGKSISGIVQLRLEDVRKSIGPTLVASLLFCLIESLQGHFASALRHIAAGLNLLIQCEKDMTIVNGLPNDLFEALSQTFISLGMQAMALESELVAPVLSRYLTQSHFRTSCSFSTTEQALREVASLQIDGMRVLGWADSTKNDLGFPCSSLQQAAQALHQRLDTWSTMFDQLKTVGINLTGVEGHRSRLAILALRINQHVTKIILSVIFTIGQSAFDAQVEEFAGLMSCAEEIARIELEYMSEAGKLDRPIFNMAMGIIPAVFYTCIRCRDHSIRHRALIYLKVNKRREALWDTGVVASLAEEVITVEEAAAAHYLDIIQIGAADLSPPELRDTVHPFNDLPDSQRIERLEVDFLDRETSAKVSLIAMDGAHKHQATLVWKG